MGVGVDADPDSGGVEEAVGRGAGLEVADAGAGARPDVSTVVDEGANGVFSVGVDGCTTASCDEVG